MGPQKFHQQLMFGNFCRMVGVKGEVWGIFPGYVGKIIDLNFTPMYVVSKICKTIKLYNILNLNCNFCEKNVMLNVYCCVSATTVFAFCWMCSYFTTSHELKVPGNSAGDLFGMAKTSDPFKGCWWPPTFGDKKVTAAESPGSDYSKISPIKLSNISRNFEVGPGACKELCLGACLPSGAWTKICETSRSNISNISKLITVDGSEIWQTTWHVRNPVNNGINYLSLNWWSPDFWLPSTVGRLVSERFTQVWELKQCNLRLLDIPAVYPSSTMPVKQYCWWKKSAPPPQKKKRPGMQKKTTLNNGINYQPQLVNRIS